MITFVIHSYVMQWEAMLSSSSVSVAKIIHSAVTIAQTPMSCQHFDNW